MHFFDPATGDVRRCRGVPRAAPVRQLAASRARPALRPAARRASRLPIGRDGAGGLDEFWRSAIDVARVTRLRAGGRALRADVYSRARRVRRDVRRRRRRPDPCVVSPPGGSRERRRFRAASRSSATAAGATCPRPTRTVPGVRLTRRSSWTRARRAARGRPGDTPDPGAGASGAEHPGVMTRGIASPETYYYRRLYVDAVRAVETAAGCPGVDPAPASASPARARAARSRSPPPRSPGRRAPVPRRRAVPERHRARDRDRDRSALHRARHVPRHSTRELETRRAANAAPTSTTRSSPPRITARTLDRRRPARHDHAALDGLRGLQRDRSGEGDRRVPVLGTRAADESHRVATRGGRLRARRLKPITRSTGYTSPVRRVSVLGSGPRPIATREGVALLSSTSSQAYVHAREECISLLCAPGCALIKAARAGFGVAVWNRGSSCSRLGVGC